MSTEIRRKNFRKISEMAARYEAVEAAHTMRRGGNYGHPTDDFGTLISEAWQVDQDTCITIMAGYISQLREECDGAGLTPPTLEAVLEVLPFAINEGRNPWMTEDVQDQMVRQLRTHVPDML